MREITYQFTCNDQVYRHAVSLDLQDGQPDANDSTLPDWTKLDYHQCKGCKWDKSDRCPVAVRLAEPAFLLDKLYSYETVDVTVETPDRTYHKTCDVQEGLYGLFGLIMSRSGCPAFDSFRGLGWFHLPFASYEETLFRVISSYLLQRYLTDPNASQKQIIEEVQAIYEQVCLVNRGIVSRLRAGAAPQCDSPYNAVTMLDSMGSMVAMSIEDGLEDIRPFFG